MYICVCVYIYIRFIWFYTASELLNIADHVADYDFNKQILCQSSCLYRASMTIKTLYYPADAQIYNYIFVHLLDNKVF